MIFSFLVIVACTIAQVSYANAWFGIATPPPKQVILRIIRDQTTLPTTTTTAPATTVNDEEARELREYEASCRKEAAANRDPCTKVEWTSSGCDYEIDIECHLKTVCMAFIATRNDTCLEFAALDPDTKRCSYTRNKWCDRAQKTERFAKDAINRFGALFEHLAAQVSAKL